VSNPAAAPLAFIATCDLSAVLRGRSVPGAAASDTLSNGVGWVPANLAINSAGHLASEELFGTCDDLRLIPDESSRSTVTADDCTPAVDVYLADQTEIDGSPWPGCPRTFLRDSLAELDAVGLTVSAAFEHEFTLTGMDAPQPFSFTRFRSAEPFGTELVALLDAAGLEPETWLPEYGHGQYEITVRPAAGIAAADRAVLLRELVRDLARRRGRRASFAPLPDPGDVGNGVHVHLSLHDREGRPALYDPERPGRLSELGGAFAAGIVTHARALAAVTAASPASYLRLVPHQWSVGGIYLADRDREALLRIAPTPGPLEGWGVRFNLEYRAADATANPWLTLAVLLRAGLHGIANGYTTPQIGTKHEPVVDAPPLPASLDDALDALEKDEVVRGWFAPTLLETYLAVKRSDAAACAGMQPAELCRHVGDIY
jgi:glutamine synthetase